MTYQEEFNNSLGTERMLYLLRHRSNEINPSDFDNIAIQWASQSGHVKIVKELLKDDRVDPSDRNNLAIRWASNYGHIEIVKLLLKDKRVDPSDMNNHAIQMASFNGYTEVVKTLEDHIKFVRNKKLYCRMLIHI